MLFFSLILAFAYSTFHVGAQPRSALVRGGMCEARLSGSSADLASIISNEANSDTYLNFSKTMGQTENRFFRQNDIAAHIVANYGNKSSVVIGFADGGNSGVSMWLDQKPNLKMRIKDNVKVASEQDGLHGIVTEIEAEGVDSLSANDFALGNIRRIRDREDAGKKFDAVDERVEWLPDGRVKVTRTVSQDHRYEMILEAQAGGRFQNVNGKVTLVKEAGAPGSLRFRVTALTSEPLLTAVPLNQIVRPEYLNRLDRETLNMLSFVVYHEKWLAGSWRYLTYFGRDSMMSAMLMMKVLKPQAVAAALAGVLERVDESGRVSHEETLADYAYFLSGYKSFAPRQDYEMIDSNFMLPILISQYFSMASDREANAFLDRRTSQNVTYREVLRRNLQFTLSSAYSFANYMSKARQNNDEQSLKSGYKYLLHLLPGRFTGQWRDSQWGLGLGVIPYDTNVAIMPAALAAAYDIFSSARYGLGQELNARRARFYYNIWKTEAPKFFEVKVTASDYENASAYMQSIGLAMPNEKAPKHLTYAAISLNENGSPVRVMNSDEGSYLMLGLPSDAELMSIADRVLLEFPFGLKSPIGLLIANAAFAPVSTQQYFTADHYHGTLAWGREHAIMLFGLLRQLERNDIQQPTRDKLLNALQTLWDIMGVTAPYQEAELWTWTPVNGRMQYLAYGSKPTHHTFANPIQTWSIAVAVLRESVRPQVTGFLGSQAALHSASAN